MEGDCCAVVRASYRLIAGYCNNGLFIFAAGVCRGLAGIDFAAVGHLNNELAVFIIIHSGYCRGVFAVLTVLTVLTVGTVLTVNACRCYAERGPVCSVVVGNFPFKCVGIDAQ